MVVGRLKRSTKWMTSNCELRSTAGTMRGAYDICNDVKKRLTFWLAFQVFAYPVAELGRIGPLVMCSRTALQMAMCSVRKCLTL